MNRRIETKAVKQALIEAGIPVVRVGHGTGTASGWLHIKFTEQVNRAATVTMGRQVVAIAQAVTGRKGEYDGEINWSSAANV